VGNIAGDGETIGVMKNLKPDRSGWRSRGYLPHFDHPELIQFITMRLWDAVPDRLIRDWKIELAWSADLPSKDKRRIALQNRIERYADAGHGSCYLGDDWIAGIVESALLHFDGRRYRVLGWCILPNHVHIVIEIFERFPMEDVLQTFKSYTAHASNRTLQRSGPFWFREYYDRYIRDADHFDAVCSYVESNPVKAGLVSHNELWRWSSAWKGRPGAPAARRPRFLQ
jgi:putative transposase